MVELGLYDPEDEFWSGGVDVTSLSTSELDLLERLDRQHASL